MAELPRIPDLDPQQPSSETPAAQTSLSTPTTGPNPRAPYGDDTFVGPPPSAPSLAPQDPQATPTTANAQAAAAGAGSTPVGDLSSAGSTAATDPRLRPAMLGDAVEEILDQTSDQVLRIGHVADSVQGVGQTLEQIRQQMHAGFAETLSAVENRGQEDPQEAGVERLWRQGTTDRLDALEAQASKTVRVLTIMLALFVLQALAVTTAAYMVISHLPSKPAPVQQPGTAPRPGNDATLESTQQVQTPPAKGKGDRRRGAKKRGQYRRWP